MARRITAPDGTVHEFPDEATDDQIIGALQSRTGQANPRANDPRAQLGRFAVKNLGTIGGVLGAPGGVIGAGLLGGAGHALSEAIGPLVGNEGSKSIPELGARIATEGATQAAGAGVGKLAGKAATRTGRYLMDRAIRPTPALRQQFGDVTETALKERVGPNVGGGSARVASQRTASSAGEEAMAAATPAKATVLDIALPSIRQAEKRLGRQLAKNERSGIIQSVRKRAQELLSMRTGGSVPERLRTRFTASETRQLRQFAREEAAALKKARATGNATVKPDADVNIEAGAKRWLNRNVPGMAEQTGRTRELIGLERALMRAELPGETRTFAPIKIGWASPLGIEATPRGLASASLGLTDPATARFLSRVPGGPFGVAGSYFDPMSGFFPDDE